MLVHCSDGWDRTSQVSALAQLLLDPHFRTLDGFAVLVEKDWLAFGYRFRARTGHGSDAGGDDNRSPCFLQFVDCVWQLLRLFPAAFQFNERFLLCVLEHLYSCKFGTFLCDCEAERVRAALPLKTISVWDLTHERRAEFTNHAYAPAPGELERCLPLLPHATVVARQVRLWDAYYLRFAGAPSLVAHAFCHLQHPDLRRPTAHPEAAALAARAALAEAMREKSVLQGEKRELEGEKRELEGEVGARRG